MSGFEKYPRLLIIGNCCLSDTTSNGRTLKNFLIGWPKDKIAQFCIRFESPDFLACDNYYCVSDRDALNAFLLRGSKNGKKEILDSNEENIPPITNKQVNRNALSMYIRDIVWSSHRWQGKYFKKWVDEFSPELILFQAGDFGYLCRLAVNIAKERNIPIVIYNSEAYYFKNFDYLGSKGIAKLFYPLFRKRFCKSFEKLMKRASAAVYICDMLKEDYEKHFDVPAYTIYTATGNKFTEKKIENREGKLTVSYLGNLGVGRHEGLVDIGNALQSISKDLYLDVYGKIPNEKVQKAFDGCEGIHYCGFVSYEQVKQIMRESDILVHTENFSDYYRLDLKYAFSTKIADSLASGTCFLLYAPEELAVSQYLTNNNVAYVVNYKKELKTALEMLVNESDSRSRYAESAQALVEKNHISDKNSEEFQKILKNTVCGE